MQQSVSHPSSRRRWSARSLSALLLPAAALLLWALLGAAPARAGVYTGEIAYGPDGGLQSIGNVDLAPDGSGAIAYTVNRDGVDHVFVSRLVNGGWGAPEQVDPGLPDASSQIDVATADGGRVVATYVNAGNVYAATRASYAANWSVQQLWGGGGASSPSVDLSVNRKGYIAFTAPGAGGHDVRAAYSKDAAPWQLAGAALDADPNADAGVGAGRPRVAAAASGLGVVVWGESGTVFARRVSGTTPSTAAANAAEGLSIEGMTPTELDSPVVGAMDDDSYTPVAFLAHFNVGGADRTRVVYHRLRGSRFEWATSADALPFSSGQNSVAPELSNGGLGQGIVLGSSDSAHLTYAQMLRSLAAPADVLQVDSIVPSTAPTFATSVTATPLKMMVAWQLTDAAGGTQVQGRFWDGRTFQPEATLSSPQLGPTDASRGLVAAGDDSGDILIAWVQNVPGQGPAIATYTLDQPPPRFARKALRTPWQRTDRPTLAWSPTRDRWGLAYHLVVDSADVAQTGGTKFRLGTAVTQGAHSWQVIAVDRRGQQFQTSTGTFRVDSVAPTARLKVSGALHPSTITRLTIASRDAPPPVTTPGAKPAQTSGVASVLIDWGDKSRRERVKRGSQHAYRRTGRYAIRVTVTDKAGNKSIVRHVVKITTPPRPRRGARGRDGTGGGGAGGGGAGRGGAGAPDGQAAGKALRTRAVGASWAGGQSA
ncbi:MAG TPA: hypothetical protein VGM91_14720 [Conexibacter sp.]